MLGWSGHAPEKCFSRGDNDRPRLHHGSRTPPGTVQTLPVVQRVQTSVIKPAISRYIIVFIILVLTWNGFSNNLIYYFRSYNQYATRCFHILYSIPRTWIVGGQWPCDFTMTTTHCYHDNYTQWPCDLIPYKGALIRNVTSQWAGWVYNLS